mmetsp:Transcript_20688/g.30949  ORF Transcript_20688/g.30949 Transcript_20688/m.30949 type:complete len:411 (-) Transcript_20688:195-1427(-)
MQVLEHVKCGNSSRPLRLLQITDTHLFPEGVKTFTTHTKRVVDLKKEGYSNDTAKRLLKLFVKEVKPDVVVFTGDIIDGRPFGEHKRVDFKSTMREFIQPLVENKIHWTYTPGNHDDDECDWTRSDLLTLYDLPMCLSKGAKNFNHTVTVGPSAMNCVRLWLFDSGENHDDPKVRYTTFDKKAVQGYEEISAKLRKAREPAVGLAFFHIPFPEYTGPKPLVGTLGLFDAAVTQGTHVPLIAKLCPSLVKCLGKHRVSGGSLLNSGLAAAMISNGNIRATFCGHDHYNDAVMWLYGLYMVYGRVSSTTAPVDWQGEAGPLPFDLGARVIEVRSQGKVATWVHSEKGEEKKSLIIMDPFYKPKGNRCLNCLCDPWTPWILNVLLILGVIVWILIYAEVGVESDDSEELDYIA